jgi:enamine deaminase RidA (YjgF/YER057c/UK114 family)
MKEDGCLLRLKAKTHRENEVNSIQATAISGTYLFPLRQHGRNIGVVYEDDYARYCRLSGVIPLDLTHSREDQTRAVLEMLEWILTTNGFSFTDTVRTWFYLDQLLDWYKEFNEVRTIFFDSRGVFDQLVPASTGIGAANPWGAALACDLLAIQPKIASVRIEAVSSPLQDSALKYASSFSRAVEVHMPSHRSLLISGTASIDADGNTQYRDNHTLQIERTIEVVTALLNSRKMGWGNVTRGIAYFADMSNLETFKKVCRTTNIPFFSLAVANADICRHDLLFELEVDAITFQE